MSLAASQVAQARLAVQDWMGDLISVETYAGEGAYGPVYTGPVDVTCKVDQTRQIVRNSNGEEVVSQLTLQVAVSDEAKFTPGSRMTFGTLSSIVITATAVSFSGQHVYLEVTGT